MNYRLEKIKNKVIFTLEEEEYELGSHPYEPCLYFYKNDAIIKILHNAFDVYDLVEKYNSGETVLGPDGRSFDLDSFCRVLSAALSDKRYEMNWTYVANHVE